MLTQRLAKQTISLGVLALALSACGSKSGSKQGASSPAPQAAPASTTTTPAATTPAPEVYNPQLGQEYQQLPATILIGANTDAHGSPVAGSAQLRVPTSGAQLDSAAHVFDAYNSAAPAAASNELNGSTSSQSWGTYQNVSNYSTYSPSINSAQVSGFTYTYGNPQSYTTSGQAVYAYSRPACTPVYCTTTAVATSGAPSAVQPPTGSTWDSMLAAAFNQYGVYAIKSSEFYSGSQEEVELGQRLFNDPLLSASGQMSCASCHIQQRGTSNSYSLAPNNMVLTGQKTSGFVPTDLLPRNVPGLLNVGHDSFQTFFWDSRVSHDVSAANGSGFDTPAGTLTPLGLSNALAAQALFPLVNANEMGDTAVSSETDTQQWSAVMSRIMSNPTYPQMMAQVYPQSAGNYGIQDVANAIAAYEAVSYQAINSPWDQYVAGNLGALNDQQKRGAVWFYGKGGCARCHSGALQTDYAAHATGTPQFGSGGDGIGGYEDYGFARTSGNPADRYKFKTPSLRNVATTGPWGHDGAWSSLRQVVEHYINPAQALDNWDPTQVILPSGFYISGAMLADWNDQNARSLIKAAIEPQPVALASTDVDDIMEFLLTLTDGGIAQNVNSTIVRNQP